MTMAINVSGVLTSITDAAVRSGGVVKVVSEGLIRSDGALLQFFAKLQVKLAPASVIGRANSAAVANVVSAPVTATAIGAVGDVTHAWTRTSPDAHAWTIDNPTGASTTFSTLAGQGESFDATFIDTITDQAGQVLASSPVAVNCANIYYGGGFEGSLPPAPGSVYP